MPPYKKNLADVAWVEMSHGDRFQSLRKRLTPETEKYAAKVGLSLYCLKPGKRAFPFHYHMANDEALLVLKGAGALRYGDEEIPLREGDYVHLPAAAQLAHQVINSGKDDFEYLCFSSMIQPEIAIYPDSGKVGLQTAASPSAPTKRPLLAIYHDSPIGYWDGEAEA